ncbi:hypothetical protein GGR51DRAFT_562644 [Nemania sp. FL0031]|nr:hypothetical protein GGR51DRAFT_562644 [Nemania sp. FL0031]
MASGPSSEALLSFRTSCNRCRFQKLKCSILASSEAPKGTICCQRCARAMVPCVFSRRSKSRRAMAESYSDAKQSRARPATTLGSGDCGVTVTSGPCPGMNTKVFAFDGGWNQVSTQNTLTLNGVPASSSTLGYAFQEDSAIDHMELFTNGINLAVQGNNGELSLPNFEIAADSPDSGGENNSSSRSTAFDTNVVTSERSNAIGMLLSLSSDLQIGLETLENRPRQQRETPQALDGYPIGSVLHLLQKFTNIVGVLWKMKSDSGTGQINWLLGPDSTQLERGGTETTTAPCLDIPVTLILLSCYITTTQICSIVLGHFQCYLISQPGSRIGASPTRANPGPQVCLGELPPTDPPHSRIYTAVCMLLESLGQAEEALGLPPHIRVAEGLQSWEKGGAAKAKALPNASAEQSLVGTPSQWEELTSVACVQGSFTVLAKKVDDIKELLREKMGL